jgi:hypothetical protein
MYRPTPLTAPGAFAESEGGGRDEMLEVRGYPTGTKVPAYLVVRVAGAAVHTFEEH